MEGVQLNRGTSPELLMRTLIHCDWHSSTRTLRVSQLTRSDQIVAIDAKPGNVVKRFIQRLNRYDKVSHSKQGGSGNAGCGHSCGRSDALSRNRSKRHKAKRLYCDRYNLEHAHSTISSTVKYCMCVLPN